MKGWLKTTLGNHVDIITGYPFKSELYTEAEKSIRLLRGDNIIPGSTRWDGVKYWSLDKVEGLNKYYLNPQDLIIAMDRVLVSNGLKITIIQDEDVPALLVQRVARLRASKGLDQNFLPYLVMSHRFEQYVKSVQTETAIPHISTQQISDFPIVLPPLLEQCRIAEILGAWDESIDLLERLIGKTRSRKQGLMQQLLTGKKRFKEFNVNSSFSTRSDFFESKLGELPDDWKIFNLPDVLYFQEGPGVQNYQFTQSGVKLLNGSNIQKAELILDNTSRYIDEDEAYGKYKHFLVDAGDLVIASSGISVDKFENKIAFVTEKDLPLCMNTSTIRFKVINKEEVNLTYFKYFMMTSLFKDQIRRQITGSAQLNFGPTHLNLTLLVLPPILEQEKIAAVLSAADEEISMLEKQLAAYKQQKLGLMQQLLTGKIRVGMI